MTYQSLVDFQYWTLIAQILNLFVQMYLFKRFLFKPIQNIIAKRQSEVDTLYSEADQAKAEAEEAKNTYEQRIQNAHAEAEVITSKAIESAKLRSSEIIGTAEHEAQRLREKTSREIALEKRKAVEDVKAEISEIAVEIAAKVVEDEIDAEKHDRMISQFIDSLGD